MSETGEVIGQASPEFWPCSVHYRRSCCLFVIRRSELLARHVRQRRGQFRLSAYPLCQVVERFLCLNRCTVKAQHKRQSRGSIAPLEEPVVHQGKEQLAHIRCRQDATLHREIVLGSFGSDVAYTIEQV